MRVSAFLPCILLRLSDAGPSRPYVTRNWSPAYESCLEGLCVQFLERVFKRRKATLPSSVLLAGWHVDARLALEQLCWTTRCRRDRAVTEGAWTSETTEPGGCARTATSRLLETDKRNQVSNLLLFGVFCNKQPDLLLSDTDTGKDT